MLNGNDSLKDTTLPHPMIMEQRILVEWKRDLDGLETVRVLIISEHAVSHNPHTHNERVSIIPLTNKVESCPIPTQHKYAVGKCDSVEGVPKCFWGGGNG